jgi:hypothetical protein
MKTLLKCVLAACLIIGLSYSVFGEVVEKSIDTDSSWKCLDVEDPGWTEVDYNDSWWESAANRSMPSIAESSSIWYPNLYPRTVYFRKTFEIDNLSIISANLYYGVAEGSNGSVDLYVNGHYIWKFYKTTNNPSMSNITSFLQVGKNVIAARVEEQDQFYWSLSGVIRYRVPESTTGLGVPTQYSGFAGPVQISQPNGTLYGQNIGFDASVTIRSAQYRGYDVTVDGFYVGTDGRGGDPLDGVYTFKVAANQPHTIRVDHPWNWKSWSFWHFAGESYVYDF